jgi:hypothetical protein
MIIFTNPGLIELEAVRTMGVSVKLAGSFGRFGTGLKFAIATILRGGGEITIYRNEEPHTFGTVELIVRDQPFQVITLDGEKIGITTQLGRDWEPWMVLRELGCNALDEGGLFGHWDEDVDFDELPTYPEEGTTRIIVRWDDLEVAYKQRKELFVEGEVLWQNENLRILAGTSAHIFYRGVRVLKLAKPSLVTYDILAEQILTEDRTLTGTWRVDGLIRDAFLGMENKELISQALTAEDGYHENKLDYTGSIVSASRAFLDAAIEARESRKLQNDSAKKVMLRHRRDAAEETSSHGSYRRVTEDAFTYAIEQLHSIGMKFLPEQKFITIDELPGEASTLYENGRIYLLASLVKKPAREIMTELLRRWVDINIEGYSQDDVVRLLAPFIIAKAPSLKADEQLTKEDETIEDLADDPDHDRAY